MNLHTIPAGVPFLETLARWWLDRGTDPLTTADGLFLLPTRRAARALMDAFLAVSDGRPLLLPRIVALGAIDEAPLTLAGALDLPPAVSPARRLAVLTRMILALNGAQGAPMTADRAWPLAIELASLLDEAHRAEIVLADVLPQAAALEHAAHWDRTVAFLTIVTEAWPAWLRDNGLMDGAERARRLLDAQGAAWEDGAPHPVVVAGTTGGVPAVARLIRTVARMKQGRVVLPGVDLAMDPGVWDALGAEPSHPQAGFWRLLNGLGATRDDVAAWDAPSLRADTLTHIMLPAAALAGWRTAGPHAMGDVTRLAPADEQEEAVAIALVLRDALEQPGVRAALVTPDRALAVRVAAELRRYGVVADDSAGEPLTDMPPGAFLRLLARCVADGFGPVALLSVCKHPLAGLGMTQAACRAGARALELLCLRGPAPSPGLDGLRAAAQRAAAARPGPRAEAAEAALALLDQLAARMLPLLTLARATDAAPADALRTLIQAAEALAETDAADGAHRLWAGEEGDALSTHLAELLDALPVLPPQPLATLPGLLDASMAGAMVRTRRALRGLPGAEHPRVAILGLLEARLLTADTVVLGGLAEGVWPATTDPGPWMSRPMRTACGLPAPEERVGQAAHDFSMLVTGAAQVVLSCPRRRDGAPAVPSRWLVRIEAYLRGQAASLPLHPAAAWAAALDLPAGPPVPVEPPTPRPPVALRPTRLSVSEIQTWQDDPYAIHAKHILRLRPLEPLELAADQSDYGTIVHAAIAAWVTQGGDLQIAMDQALDAAAVRPALSAWWRPRLHRIAAWVVMTERQRPQPLTVAAEADGVWVLPGGAFTLTGRADRIEKHPDGLVILDYKTGATPNKKDVGNNNAPQLPLEAAMARHGAFGLPLSGPSQMLVYWKLTGGLDAGKETICADPDGAIATKAAEGLTQLATAYAEPGQAYRAQPRGRPPRYPRYSQLARVGEWSAPNEEQDE